MIPQAELVLFGPPSEPWYKRVALARRYRKGWQRVASGDSGLRWTGGSRLTPEGTLYVQEVDLRDGCLQLFAGSSNRTSLDSREYSYGIRRDVRGAYVELLREVDSLPPNVWAYEDVEAAGGDSGGILFWKSLEHTILDDLDGYRTPAGPILTFPDVSAADRAVAERFRASLIAQGLPDPGEARWFIHLDVG